MCERLRRDANVATPIVMLTAKGELDDKLEGFRAGADDYLAKPFALRELEARIQALVRRARRGLGGATVIGHCRPYVTTRKPTRSGAATRAFNSGALPASCSNCCCANHRAIVSRERLEYEIWGDDVPDGDQLRSHMSMLRRAIDRPFPVKLIHTVHGTGYRLAETPIDA